MTQKEFRQSPDLRARLNEFLADPIIAQAIVIVEKSNPVLDPRLDAPEISSVRALSRIAGHQGAIEMLVSMGEPWSEPVDMGDPTYEPPVSP